MVEEQFKNSPHVSHMCKHREEYVGTLRSFLNQIDYFKNYSQGQPDETAAKTEKTESSETGRL